MQGRLKTSILGLDFASHMADVTDSRSGSSCDILRWYWFEPDRQLASGICCSACGSIMLQSSYTTEGRGLNILICTVGPTAHHHNCICPSLSILWLSSASCHCHHIGVRLTSGKNSMLGTTTSQVPLVPLKVALQSSIFFGPKAMHLPLVRNTWSVPKGQKNPKK